MSDVVAGVVFASREASRKAKAALQELLNKGSTSHKGSVANMSLGGGKSRALDDAVNTAVDSGLHFAVAAGMFRFRSKCMDVDVSFFKAMTIAMLASIPLLPRRRLSLSVLRLLVMSALISPIMANVSTFLLLVCN